MGLEWRGGNLYYYQKERDGDRVRSVYSGSGEIAYLLHQMSLLKRDEDAAEKDWKNKERRREE